MQSQQQHSLPTAICPIVRLYKPVDYQAILALAGKEHQALYDTPQADMHAFIIDMATYNPEITIKVVEIDHRMCAFIIYTLNRYSGARINYLAVEPRMRNFGCAGALLSAICEHAQQEEYESVIVSVIETNNKAIAWYVKRGFTLIQKQYDAETEIIYLEKVLER